MAEAREPNPENPEGKNATQRALLRTIQGANENIKSIASSMKIYAENSSASSSSSSSAAKSSRGGGGGGGSIGGSISALQTELNAAKELLNSGFINKAKYKKMTGRILDLFGFGDSDDDQNDGDDDNDGEEEEEEEEEDGE